MIELATLAAAARRLPAAAGITVEELEPLAQQGLAHDHVRLKGRGLLLRVPKQSQFALAAEVNLNYQATCFARVAASGHGPRLFGLIEPSKALPLGALLVEEIRGRPPRLPQDLAALAEAMAAVHAMPLPEVAARPPLKVHLDPVAGMLSEIEAQALFIPAAELESEAAAEISDELGWARGFAAEVAAGRHGNQPLALVLTDTHPGNFLVTEAGRAIIVDLEKALYGAPGVDLAHASVYSSTTWDVATYAELSLAEVAAFYRDYLARLPAERAAALRPWLVPMRRLLFLRAITWCVKWQVAHQAPGNGATPTTEDWSAERSDPALVQHVAGRVADYLSPASLKRMRSEWLANPDLDALI